MNGLTLLAILLSAGLFYWFGYNHGKMNGLMEADDAAYQDGVSDGRHEMLGEMYPQSVVDWGGLDDYWDVTNSKKISWDD